MQITEKKKKYKVADYLMLEEGAPFQLIDYELIMSPSPTSYHQLISARILFIMMNYMETTGNEGFLVASPIDVILNDGNAFQPDIVYVSAERRSEIVKDRVEGAPDLVIEILSPSNGYYDLRFKKDIYEKYGVKEYIIIDPLQGTLEVYVLDALEYKLHQKAHTPGTINSVLLPGLTFDLQKLFKQ